MSVETINYYGDVCCRAAKSAGAILLEMREKFSVHEKAPKDLVTDVDLASQAAIQNLILGEFPSHQFLGEESRGAQSDFADNEPLGNSEQSFRWIVDPLDGTVNYVHGLQSYSVSIALHHRNELLVGAVYDPILDELYYAAKDQPATLNGHVIQASQCVDIAKSLAVISLPSNVRRHDLIVEQMIRLIEQTRSMRRLGSAALNLCYIACGRLDAYFATSLKPWDIAAGALILQQAGGVIRHCEDRELDFDDPRILATGTDQLWRQTYAIIRD